MAADMFTIWTRMLGKRAFLPGSLKNLKEHKKHGYLGESMEWALPAWGPPQPLYDKLSSIDDPLLWGEYLRAI